MRYSIVIPVHNEGENVEPFVTAFVRNLPRDVVLNEILLVENGSTDNSLEACNRLQERFPEQIRVMAIALASYGEAIKHGMLEATGTHLSILECDCLNAEFVSDSMRLFRDQKARFVVASKRHPQSVDERPLKRRLFTALFNYFLRHGFGYPGTDTHGLKSIQTGFAKQLCRLAVTSDEVFQTEIVLLAWCLGEKIHETPIRIRETRSTPVAVFKRIPRVLAIGRELRRSLRRFQKGTSPFMYSPPLRKPPTQAKADSTVTVTPPAQVQSRLESNTQAIS